MVFALLERLRILHEGVKKEIYVEIQQTPIDINVPHLHHRNCSKEILFCSRGHFCQRPFLFHIIYGILFSDSRRLFSFSKLISYL